MHNPKPESFGPEFWCECSNELNTSCMGEDSSLSLLGARQRLASNLPYSPSESTDRIRHTRLVHLRESTLPPVQWCPLESLPDNCVRLREVHATSSVTTNHALRPRGVNYLRRNLFDPSFSAHWQLCLHLPRANPCYLRLEQRLQSESCYQ